MIGKNGRTSYMNNSFEESIVLIDSSYDIDNVKELEKNKHALFITFDYESHKALSKIGIPHKKSDDFLNEEDLRLIQKNSYHFSKWFNQEPISKLLEYDGINLGQLFYVEFHYFLIPILKKFLEINKIFNLYKNSKFIASTELCIIINQFTDLVREFEQNSTKKTTFLYDSLKFTFNLKGISFTLNLSKEKYMKLKRTSEQIIHFLFGPKDNFKSPFVLLVEFDTIRYRKLFSLLPVTSINAAVFNRRKPSIWNYRSFSIIKNSKCRVITSYDLNDISVENSVTSGISKIDNIIQSLAKQDELFRSFFVTSGFSFWDVIKEKFLDLCKKRMKDAIPEIEMTKLLIQKYEFNSILVWNENGFNEQIVIKLAKTKKIRVILIQHGLYYDTPESLQYNEFAGVMPHAADIFFVWGKALQNYATNYGIEPKKIHVSGSSTYDELFEKRDFVKKEDFILLATSSPVKNLVNDLTVETMENYENTIRKICQIVSKLNKKLVIKLHPFQEEIDITQLVKEIDPNIVILKAQDIVPLISACQVLLTIDLSTTILEAQILHKPVVSVLVKDYEMGIPEIFKSNSCITSKIDTLEETLSKILNDENFRESIIKNGDKFVDYYLSNQGTATRHLFKYLDTN